MSSQELTLSIIKPDAFSKNVSGSIIQKIQAQEIRIVSGHIMQLSIETTQQFYAIHSARPFFSSLVEFMASGPIWVLALYGDDAIRNYRELMGATNPADAPPGTLRALFGENIEKNAVHGSDAPETAQTEIEFFFKKCDLFI